MLTNERCLIVGWKPGHDGHEEDSHVQHGGDAQGDLLTRLRRDQEHKPDRKGSQSMNKKMAAEMPHCTYLA